MQEADLLPEFKNLENLEKENNKNKIELLKIEKQINEKDRPR
jgi:hypothetical protein